MLPDKFTYPFRYTPCAEIVTAADELMRKIDSDCHLASLFKEGKMMGVLWAELPEGGTAFLYAFSGNVSGTNHVDGFVPPILDLLDKDGYFAKEERRISDINQQIDEILNSKQYLEAKTAHKDKLLSDKVAIDEYRQMMKEAKARRSELRAQGLGDETQMIRESQFQKAELKRLQVALAEETSRLKAVLDGYESKVAELRVLRKTKSDELQRWIFDNCVVMNALGEKATVWEVFESQGICPPGGTGECAAPKLLNYAYANGMRPLAMGEFWYGDALDSGESARVHGHFYPSCTSKCGPLLPWMLRGLEVDDPFDGDGLFKRVRIEYEDDDLIVAVKPSGVLSVPGKNGGVSLMEHLSAYPVHRLDMDTSGLIVYAKNLATQAALQRAFENREVVKTYQARLEHAPSFGSAVELTSDVSLLADLPLFFDLPLLSGVSSDVPLSAVSVESDFVCCDKRGQYEIMASGRISLPLMADYDNRPAQKVDYKSGKEAVTEFVVLQRTGSADGNNCRAKSDSMTEIDACCPVGREQGRTISDREVEVLFRPVTGRTHQLRVHASHPDGLGAPIVGDRLYGSSVSGRLLLHACHLSFVHPSIDKEMKLVALNQLKCHV